MAGALRTLKRWGVKALIQTNASSSLRHDAARRLMLINDRINARSAARWWADGHARRCGHERRLHPELRAHARAVAATRGRILPGVSTSGLWARRFETPAEIRMFAAWGASCRGHEHGARDHPGPPRRPARDGPGLMTNMAAGMSAEALTHELTLKQAAASAERDRLPGRPGGNLADIPL